MKTTLSRILTWLVVLSVASCSSTCRKRKAAPRDAGVSETSTPLNRLPPGLRIEATHVRLKVPLSLWSRGTELRTSEVIELKVTSTEPIPARALDPVLVIGDHAITHYRYADPRTLIFTEPAPATLPAGPITFRWGDTGPTLPTGASLDRKSLISIDR